MLICQSIARAINRSISHFFFSLSRNVPLCTSPFPFPLNGVSLCSKATSRQHRSPSFFQKHSVISIGFPCARAVLHRSIVSSSPCTVPYCAYVLSFSLRRNPLAPRHSFDPTIFCCIAVSLTSTTPIVSTRNFPPAFVPYFLVVSPISLLAHFHPRHTNLAPSLDAA